MFRIITFLQSTELVTEPLWRLVLRDLPRDPAAIVVYLLVATSVGWVWWANRRSGGRAPENDGAASRSDRYQPDSP